MTPTITTTESRSSFLRRVLEAGPDDTIDTSDDDPADHDLGDRAADQQWDDDDGAEEIEEDDDPGDLYYSHEDAAE